MAEMPSNRAAAELREALDQLLTSSLGETREHALDQFIRTYAECLDEVRERDPAATSELPTAEALEQVLAALDTPLQAGYLRRARARLDAVIGRLDKALRAATEAVLPAAPSRPFSYSDAVLSSGNGVLDEILSAPPALPVPSPSPEFGDRLREYVPPDLPRADVRKPNEPPRPGATSGLAASFVRFLEREGLQHLADFSTWASLNAMDLDEHYEETLTQWKAALADAKARHRREQFATSYCKAADVSSSSQNPVDLILRLSRRLEDADFRDLGDGPSIYQGQDPYPILPDIDLAALLRKYLLPLASEEQQVLDRAQLTVDASRAYYAEAHAATMSPAMYAAFIAAAVAVVEHPDLLAFLAEASQTTPRAVVAWLDGPQGEQARSFARAALSGVAGAGFEASGAGDLPSAEDWADRLFEFCAPGRSAGFGTSSADLDVWLGAQRKYTFDVAGSPINYIGEVEHPQPHQRTADQFLTGLAELVADYTSVWRHARTALGAAHLWAARDDIRLSPLEAQCYIYRFADRVIHGPPPVTIPDPADRQKIEERLTSIGYPVEPRTRPGVEFWESNEPGGVLSDSAKEDLTDLLGSFLAALDAALLAPNGHGECDSVMCGCAEEPF